MFFLSTTREMGNPIITTQQVPVARTHTQRCRHQCFSLALPAFPHSGCRPPTKLCRDGSAVIVKPAAVAVAATRQSFVGGL